MNIDMGTINTIVMLVGFAAMLFNQNRSTKKDYKAQVEEMATYKSKTEAALTKTDTHDQQIADVTQLTEKMAQVLEEINRQRTINMAVEIQKTNAVSMLLEHHKGESDSLGKAFEDFRATRQKADELRNVVA